MYAQATPAPSFLALQTPVEDYLPRVRAIAMQVCKEISPRLSLDDLVGYGSIGLLEAARRFDCSQGSDFWTYARQRVRGAIYDGLRETGQLKRCDYARLQLAIRANEVLQHLADHERDLQPSNDSVPTIEDDLHGLYEALSNVTVTYVASLEALVEEGAEFAADTSSIDDTLDARSAPKRVQALLSTLPERERHFIVKHYFEGKSLLEAGSELGLSKSWSSRLHARAVLMLRRQMERQERRSQ